LACLSATEVEVVYNISVAANVSNSTLQSLFEESCLYQSQIDLLNSNFSDVYTKNETDNQIRDIQNWVNAETSELVGSELNRTNITSLVIMQVENNSERFDDQVMWIKRNYLTLENFTAQWNNYTYTMTSQWANFQEERQVPGWFKYVFILAIVLIFAIVYLIKTAPKVFSKHKITKGFKRPPQLEAEDLTTNKALEEQREKLMELKSIVKSSKLKINDKYVVCDKISAGMLIDEDEVKAEIKSRMPKTRKK
jgi:hypothetical protein